MVQKKHAAQPSVRKPIRPIERQKMRAWLLDRLDDGDVSGLEWHNKQQNTFKISWRHAARQGWEPDKDADLFERWARHTGKYIDGDEPDHKRWKANFRCALNSLPDVEHLKTQSVRRGNNAFKVYKFSAEKRSKVRSRDSASSEDESVAVKNRRRMPARASRPKSYKDMEIDSDDSSDSTYSGSTGSESPAHTEVSTSDCESMADEHNRLDSQELPDFAKICAKDDYESLKPLLRENDARKEENEMEMFKQLVFQIQQEIPTQEEDESESTTSSSMTDDEILDLILDTENTDTPSEIVDQYLNVLTWNDPTINPFVHHEEEVMTSQSVIISETPRVTTEQMFSPQQMEYTSLAVL